MDNLLLTASEKDLYENVAQEIKDAWGGIAGEEILTSFETPEQSAYRLRNNSFKSSPGVTRVTDQIKKKAEAGEDLGGIDLSYLSEEDLIGVYSCLGANGVSALIEAGLKEVESIDDLDSIAYLSQVRNGLLKSNRDFFTE